MALVTPLHWQIKDDKFIRPFRFNGYAETIEFVNKVAAIADEMGTTTPICWWAIIPWSVLYGVIVREESPRNVWSSVSGLTG
jgi:hypothetical protein